MCSSSESAGAGVRHRPDHLSAVCTGARMPPNLVDGRERDLVEPRVDIDVVESPIPDSEHHATDRDAVPIHDLCIHIED